MAECHNLATIPLCSEVQKSCPLKSDSGSGKIAFSNYWKMCGEQNLVARIGRYSIVQWGVQCGLATQVISRLHGHGATTHVQTTPPPSATSAAKNHPAYFFYSTASKNCFHESCKFLSSFPTIVLPLTVRAILANLVNLMPIQQLIIDTELIRKAANQWQFQFPSVIMKIIRNSHKRHNHTTILSDVTTLNLTGQGKL